jgi:tetratricopeptide (TPR) repeat protein
VEAAGSTLLGLDRVRRGDAAQSVDCVLQSALAYENLDDYPKAIADYSEAIALDPKDADAFLYRGIDRIRNGDRPGGEADIAQAKQFDPNIGR